MTVSPNVRHVAYVAAVFVAGGLLAVGNGSHLGPVLLWVSQVLMTVGASLTPTSRQALEYAELERRMCDLTAELGKKI